MAAGKFSRVPIDKKVEYKFKTVDNKLRKIEYDDSIFLVPTENTDLKRIQSIPSILGLDFLSKNNLRFVIEPAKEIAYIEGDLD